MRMGRIQELNNLNKDKLRPYRKLTVSKTTIINNHLGYFLAIGLANLVLSLTLTLQTNTSTGNTYQTSVLGLFASLLSLVLVVGLTSWTINLYRAILEKTTNKGLTLTKSSFIPELDSQFFTRGIKYLVTSFLAGLFIGLIVVIVMLPLGLFTLGGSALFSGVVMDSLIGGFFGFIAGFFLLILIGLIVGALLSPFILPINALYVFYGDDIGIFEALKLSFTIGRKNYGRLLGTTIKVGLLNVLGILLFGVGVIYTSVWGMLIELDVMSEILGVTLADNKTFNSRKPNAQKVNVVTEEDAFISSLNDWEDDDEYYESYEEVEEDYEPYEEEEYNESNLLIDEEEPYVIDEEFLEEETQDELDNEPVELEGESELEEPEESYFDEDEQE